MKRVGRGEQERADHRGNDRQSIAAPRDGCVAGVIAHASSGIITASAPLYFVAAASPAAAPASAKARAVDRSCARSDISSVSITKRVTGTSVSTKCDSRT